MSRYEDACPFDARGRANRCENCCSASNNLPPCVAAYLVGRGSGKANVIAIRTLEVSERKAA